MDAQIPLSHKLTLLEGSKLTVTGVTEVLSFDDTYACLQTPLGRLTVQGEQLQLKTLSPDGGQVILDGAVTALFYQQNKKGGFFSRLLK